MGAIISGLLDLLQWLASTVGAFFTWLVSTIQAVAGWFLSVLQWVFVHAWNLLVDVVQWALTALFWLIGTVAVLPLDILSVLVGFLPEVPDDWAVMRTIVIPAFNVANQVLPLSEALIAGSIWLTFYGVMAIWRVITFLRGGR
ncbi:hypothetical protein [Thermus sp. LT1-2-5]|uniref:hypothetical protein n=1 Tax=Thermus sp. LT1-2-5 TaxID=3026935 RepID=UPI0033659DCD